jgi:hypothetical protein
MSWTVILTFPPSRRTEPSTTPLTPSARAISGSDFDAFLYGITDVREITFRARMRDSSVITASVIPSAKYSCSGSLERFESGSTASESIRPPFSLPVHRLLNRPTSAAKSTATTASAPSPRLTPSGNRRGRVAAGATETAVGCPIRSPSRAALRFAAAGYRRSGSFLRQVLTISRRPTDATAVSGNTGSAWRIASVRLAGTVSGKGRVPVAISHRTTPEAQISVRASTGSARSCSGAM